MPSFYRCENEFGDPCTFAKENRKIPAAEALPSMDGGRPKCPGKTQSGKDCGKELIPIKEKSFPTGPLIIAGGILGSIALIWFVVLPMFQKPVSDSTATNPPIHDPKPPYTTGTRVQPVQPPIHEEPEDTGKTSKPVDPEPRDPWWVYQQLATTSTILRPERTEP